MRAEVPAPDLSTPADILLTRWGPKPMAVDFVCSHPLSPGSYPISLQAASTHLAQVERGKFDKHNQACRAAGWDFIPFAVRPWGGMGKPAASIFKKILHKATDHMDPMARALRKAELSGLVGMVLMAQVARQLKAVFDVPLPELPPPPLPEHDLWPGGVRAEMVDPYGNLILLPAGQE